MAIGIGRASQEIPWRTRIVVEHRDGGCRIPGCCGRWVEIHHIIHWEDGGVTETYNLVALCPYHHRLHHAGKLPISGNADQPNGLDIRDQHGRPVTGAAAPAPPSRPPPDVAPYVHPTGEHLDRTAVAFTTPAA